MTENKINMQKKSVFTKNNQKYKQQKSKYLEMTVTKDVQDQCAEHYKSTENS